jgi:hypothetical protein
MRSFSTTTNEIFVILEYFLKFHDENVQLLAFLFDFQHGDASVYTVAWNIKDGKRIASAGGDNTWFVLLHFYSVPRFENFKP